MALVDGLIIGVIAALLNWLFSLREGRPAIDARSTLVVLATFVVGLLAAFVLVGLAKMAGFGGYAQYSLQEWLAFAIVSGVSYVSVLMLIYPDRRGQSGDNGPTQ